MADKVKFKKGLKANIPTTLESGTYYQCTDTGELYLATSTTEKILVKDSSKINNTANGLSGAINLLSAGTATPSDNDFYVSQYAGGGTTSTSYHRRTMSALWNYIKSKIDAAKYYIKPDAGIPKTDLASAVQTSLGKADTALQSHQSVTDNNPTLAWSTKSKVATIGSTEINVTMPANPNTDSKVTQTNTTTSAWNRLLLSANANDTTETNTSYKSGKFLANPNNGEFRIYSTSANCLSLYRQTAGAGVYINYFNNNQSTLYWRVGVLNANNFRFSYIDSSGEKLKMLLDTSGNASFTGSISVGVTSSDVQSVTKPVTMQYNSTDASLDFIFA